MIASGGCFMLVHSMNTNTPQSTEKKRQQHNFYLLLLLFRAFSAHSYSSNGMLNIMKLLWVIICRDDDVTRKLTEYKIRINTHTLKNTNKALPKTVKTKTKKARKKNGKNQISTCFCMTHTLFRITFGAFLSQIDPPSHSFLCF